MPSRASTHNNDVRRVSMDYAAERWGVSVATIRRLVASGRIKGYRLNRRIIRIDLNEVDAVFRPITTIATLDGGAE